MHFDRIACSEIGSKSIVERIAIIAHDLNCGTSILMVATLVEIPSSFRILLVVIILRKK